MKYPFKILLIVLLTVPMATFSQTVNWVNLNTGTTKNINDILFISADTGYIVGDDYLFKKTTDGGMSWFDLPAPTIGERPGNNGRIINIEFHRTFSFSQINSGLILTYEQPEYNILTDDDGATYSMLHNFDSSFFCYAEGLKVLPQNNGYTYLITYGENCDGNSVSSIIIDGPFGYHYLDSSYAVKGKFTSVDMDSSIFIFSHENGNIIRYNNTSASLNTVFLDSSGVGDIVAAGNNTWYASTGKTFFPIYFSTDNGSTFHIDSTFYPTFFYPIVNDMDFINDKVGIVGATANISQGAIIVRDSNIWSFYGASHPIRAVSILKDGSAYAAGDSGLVMKTSQITFIKVEKDIHQQINIYPNPANEILNIEIKGKLKILQLQLFDINGKLIDGFSIEESRMKIARLPAGLYFLQVITDKGRLTKKVAIN